MTRRWKRWLRGSAGAAIAAFGLLNVLAYRHARALMNFSDGGSRTAAPENLSFAEKLSVLWNGAQIPRPSPAPPPADVGFDLQPRKIRIDEAITLGAWYFPADQSDLLVVVFHGYAAEKSDMLAEARMLRELGAAVLLVDFRGSGESSASYTTIGYAEADDVVAAVSFARAELPHRKLALYGKSMGAAAVLGAVARRGVDADLIVVEAAFDTMVNTVRWRFQAMNLPSFPAAQLLVFWGGRQAGFDGFTHNPVQYAESVRCPILFLHGADDPRTQVVDGRRVFAAVRGPKQFHEFSGLGHQAAAVRFPSEWKRIVGDFLPVAHAENRPSPGL